MRSHRFTALTAAAVTVLTLAACGAQPEEEEAAAEGGSGEYPVVIEHALGTTTIEEQPERVASVNWANHEVPLALGVVPVGMAEANFGDDDDDGVLPWVDEKLDELGAETPVLFDENDGIDFEAVADTQPDVILASYSGLTQEDYDTLSDIAPVVAYPEGPGPRRGATSSGSTARPSAWPRRATSSSPTWSRRSPTSSPSTRSSRASRPCS
ncbi:ABC transporter substrate-binding protein [Nocardiopsis sp. ARC36]